MKNYQKRMVKIELKKSRTINSIRNSLTSIIANIVAILVAFIAQTMFIKLLGSEYLGLNGLFTNILTLLSLFDLGIGSAIVYNMYKPLAENDTETIKSLLKFYKKTYNIIAMIILLVGSFLIPIIEIFVGNISINVNIKLVYFLFLISTSASYVLVSKRNLLYANQESYIVNIVHSCYVIVLNFCQIFVLYLTKNYYLYLVIKIICQLIENIVISIICNIVHPYVLEKSSPLDKEKEKSIFNNVKALILHKLGGVIVLGTDNIIISKFIGLIEVGLYSNYYLIINTSSSFFGQIITSITASVGNLLISSDERKSYDIFKKVRFINFWISCFTATAIMCAIQPFIRIWIGDNYMLSSVTVLVLVINYFQKLQRMSYSIFKDSAGIWREDRIVPLIEAGLNILFSLIFVHYFGLTGVFLGTIVSGFALWFYSYPKYVYKKIFNRTYFNYAKETLGYFFMFIIILIFSNNLCNMIDNGHQALMCLIINVIISIIVPNSIIFILFRKTENFKYFKDIIKRFYSKFSKNNNG